MQSKVPSLTSPAGKEEKSKNVSILQDLNPNAAKIQTSPVSGKKLLLPAMALLAAGGALFFWFSPDRSRDAVPFVATETQETPAQPLPKQDAMAAAPTAPGNVTEQVAKAEAKPESRAGSGPAIILSTAQPDSKESTSAQANPLKTLTEETAAVPAEKKSAALPETVKPKQVHATAKVQPKKLSHPQNHHVLADAKKPAKTSKTADKTNKADALASKPHLSKTASTTGKAQPPHDQTISQRDIDIITAIVKDK